MHSMHLKKKNQEFFYFFLQTIRVIGDSRILKNSLGVFLINFTHISTELENFDLSLYKLGVYLKYRYYVQKDRYCSVND